MKKNIKIRKATKKDVKDIQKLCELLIKKEHEEYDPTMKIGWSFEKEAIKYFNDGVTKPNFCILVVVDVDKIVGFVSGNIEKGDSWRTIPKIASIDSFYILEEYRNNNLGTKLCKVFTNWAKKKGVKRVKVEATIGNDAGIKFYRRNGFKDYALKLEKKV